MADSEPKKDAVFGGSDLPVVSDQPRWLQRRATGIQKWLNRMPGRLLAGNAGWIVVLSGSMIATIAFFGDTRDDEFLKDVLALALGGSISAATTFRIVNAKADKNQ